MAKEKKQSPFAGKMKKNADKRSSGSSFGFINIPQGINMFQAKSDTTVTFDFIPYPVTDKNHPDKDVGADIATKGTPWWKLPFKIHRNVGATNDAIVCPTTFGKPCPICEEIKELSEDYDANKKAIKALKASKRNLYLVKVVAIDGEKQKKPQLQFFTFSDYNFQEIFEKQLKKKEDWEIFPDLEEGVSVEVVFDEDSMDGKNKYPVAARFDFVKRKKQYDADDLEKSPKLDECLSIMDYKELKAKFMELPEDEEDAPKEKKSKKDKKGKKEKTEAPKEKKKDKKKDDAPAEKPKDKKKGKKDKKGKKK